MKKLKIILITAVIIVACGFIYKIFISQGNKKVVVLETARPGRGDISIIVTSTGTLQPVNTVSVGSQVSGTIKKLYVDYNSVVKEGQLLAELDKSLLDAAYKQALSNHEQFQSQLTYQEENFSRQSQLFKIGAISKADYDNAVLTYNSAKAQTAASSAQVETARKNLSFANIYSPVDGTILSRSVSEGQTVAASFNTPTLFVIAKDLTQMQVEASVDEADIGNVQEGNKVTFTVDAFINDVFNGIVKQVRLNPTTTNNVVTYTTIISAPNDDMKLKPGMTASISIYTKEVSNAVLLPVKAIRFTPDSGLSGQYQVRLLHEKLRKDEAFVMVKQGNELIQKKIKTGINNNTEVEVLDGLNASDSVVISAVQMSHSEASAQGAPSSPFMPRRPGSSKKTK